MWKKGESREKTEGRREQTEGRREKGETRKGLTGAKWDLSQQQ